jgi:glycosyltransferase involved in cell wall biosynthesis
VKLSIITINKNNAAGLEKTIQSVIAQTFSDYEYIVIDGASNDGSVAVIEKYADNITYWVSEPDTGIYNAMNKGIRAAHGEYCLFLNSADCLIEAETLQNVFDEIARLEEADVYYSDWLKGDGSTAHTPENLTIHSLLEWPINHQNVLIRRNLFFYHGMYNESYKIVSDYEFFLREMWVHKDRFIHLKTMITLYDASGISSTVNYSHEKSNMLCDVFIDLVDVIPRFKEFRNSVYYDIITKYGNSRFLNGCLRIYRHIIKTRRWFVDILFRRKKQVALNEIIIHESINNCTCL